MAEQPKPHRPIIMKTAGTKRGPVTRLISPGDLGEKLKPFVFLDCFEASKVDLQHAPMHPHSGIGTVTVITKGVMNYDDPAGESGVIDYGGCEWMQAGRGAWHGRELTGGDSDVIEGFQLWLALSSEFENADAFTQFLEASSVPAVGPARVILGSYAGADSPARSPAGITYLLVTLAPDEQWAFEPSASQDVAFLSVASGHLAEPDRISRGELAAFGPGPGIVRVKSGPGGATFVMGAAPLHAHDLILGHHSVHTTTQALQSAEALIRALRPS